jgi:hypothetical protein
MSFERALHFRTTPFASVGDTLKAVDEENRRDLRIDISLLHFGQISVVGTTDHARLTLMMPPFTRQNVDEQKAHPGLGACQSEKQELELARSLCDSGSITNMVRLLSTRVEKKVTTSPDRPLAEARLNSVVCS